MEPGAEQDGRPRQFGDGVIDAGLLEVEDGHHVAVSDQDVGRAVIAVHEVAWAGVIGSGLDEPPQERHSCCGSGQGCLLDPGADQRSQRHRRGCDAVMHVENAPDPPGDCLEVVVSEAVEEGGFGSTRSHSICTGGGVDMGPAHHRSRIELFAHVGHVQEFGQSPPDLYGIRRLPVVEVLRLRVISGSERSLQRAGALPEPRGQVLTVCR